MAWQQLSISVAAPRVEALEDNLLDLGAVSLTATDAADQPIFEPDPGDHPLWSNVTVLALFALDADMDEVRFGLLLFLQPQEAQSLTLERIDDQAWERAWMDHFHPMQFGQRLWIVPRHLSPPDPEAVNLRLDPGLAFGTGTHQTTAMCLQWLDGQTMTSRQVIDYGCGSGVLGIAALLLGATSVHAVDIDPQAVEATDANAAYNDVNEQLHATTPEHFSPPVCDVMLANILLAPLLSLRGAITAMVRPGGRIAMAGVLARQAETLIEAYGTDFDLSIVDNRDDWVLVAGRRRDG